MRSLASYTAPTAITPYVTRSGQVAMFVCSPEMPTQTAVTGFVSVNSGSTALTTTVGQSGWIGQQIEIAGDNSAGSYRVMSGSGTT